MRVCCGHLLTGIIACLAVHTLHAQDGPTMEVTWTNYLAEYDNLHAGPELVFRYTIHNTSAPYATNNLFVFQLPTGTDAGLVYAWFDESPFAWQAWYGGSTTEFANTNTPIAPGGSATLEIRSDSLATRFDYMTATAVGEFPINQTPSPGLRPNFAPVLVEVPAGPYPPPKLTRVSIATNTVTLTAENLLLYYHYTLQQSAQLTDWTNVADFWATNQAQTLSLPLSPNASRQFFRLRSP